MTDKMNYEGVWQEKGQLERENAKLKKILEEVVMERDKLREMFGAPSQNVKAGPIQELSQRPENTSALFNFLLQLGEALAKLAGQQITTMRISWQQPNDFKLEVVGDSGRDAPKSSDYYKYKEATTARQCNAFKDGFQCILEHAHEEDHCFD